jgi:hypothetical protein
MINEQSHLNYYSYSGSKNGKLIEAATGSKMEFTGIVPLGK